MKNPSARVIGGCFTEVLELGWEIIGRISEGGDGYSGWHSKQTKPQKTPTSMGKMWGVSVPVLGVLGRPVSLNSSELFVHLKKFGVNRQAGTFAGVKYWACYLAPYRRSMVTAPWGFSVASLPHFLYLEGQTSWQDWEWMRPQQGLEKQAVAQIL